MGFGAAPAPHGAAVRGGVFEGVGFGVEAGRGGALEGWEVGGLGLGLGLGGWGFRTGGGEGVGGFISGVLLQDGMIAHTRQAPVLITASSGGSAGREVTQCRGAVGAHRDARGQVDRAIPSMAF